VLPTSSASEQQPPIPAHHSPCFSYHGESVKNPILAIFKNLNSFSYNESQNAKFGKMIFSTDSVDGSILMQKPHGCGF